jgi:hypothetical protein
MSKLSIKKFCAVFLSVMVAAAPRYSQAQDPGMFARVKVPFSFESGSKHFAPGVHTIRMENAHTVLIRGVSESGLALTSIEDTGERANRGVAVFQHCRDRYFMREITVTGKSRRLHLPLTKEQQHLVEIAKNANPSMVEIALLAER